MTDDTTNLCRKCHSPGEVFVITDERRYENYEWGDWVAWCPKCKECLGIAFRSKKKAIHLWNQFNSLKRKSAPAGSWSN